MARYTLVLLAALGAHQAAAVPVNHKDVAQAERDLSLSLSLSLSTTFDVSTFTIPTTLPSLSVTIPTTLPSLSVTIPTTLPSLSVTIPTTLSITIPTSFDLPTITLGDEDKRSPAAPTPAPEFVWN